MVDRGGTERRALSCIKCLTAIFPSRFFHAQAKENSLRGLEDLGGAEGLLLALETNIHQGIDSSQV